MSNHLKTAHDYGVQKALETVGYKSAEDLQRDLQALGLVEQAAPTNTLGNLFRARR